MEANYKYSQEEIYEKLHLSIDEIIECVGPCHTNETHKSIIKELLDFTIIHNYHHLELIERLVTLAKPKETALNHN